MSVVIHDLASAAERAKVTEAIIRRWITEGLKAMPVGKVGQRGPRDYRIFDSWLIDFMESRATRVMPKPAPAVEPKGRTRKAAGTSAAPADDVWLRMPDLSNRRRQGE